MNTTPTQAPSKGVNIAYWVFTGFIGAMMLMSGFMYFTSPEVVQGFAKLGFPDWFRIELGTAKLLGAVALLIPIPGRYKEWTYAGFTINFISAVIAHIAINDTANVGGPIVALVLLFASYFFYRKRNG